MLGITEASHILLNHTSRDETCPTVLGSVAHPACKSDGLRTGSLRNRALGTILCGLKKPGALTTCGALLIPVLHVEQCLSVVQHECLAP